MRAGNGERDKAMTVTITAQQLDAHRACSDQAALFKRAFGEKVTFHSLQEIEAAADEYGTRFDMEWAAEKLLQESAFIEFEALSKAASDEFMQVLNKTYNKYSLLSVSEDAKEHCDGLWEASVAEVQPELGPAREKFNKAVAKAFAIAYWKQETKERDER